MEPFVEIALRVYKLQPPTNLLTGSKITFHYQTTFISSNLFLHSKIFCLCTDSTYFNQRPMKATATGK